MAAVEASEMHYLYPGESALLSEAGDRHLRLVTSCIGSEDPCFFHGLLIEPSRVSDLLLAIAKVAQSRFYVPPAMVARILREADPVVTSDGSGLRFEAFSQCCGVYARADLLPAAIDGTFQGRGTTNVDFNSAMRNALAQIGEGEEVGLKVGLDAVELERASGKVVERKVALPARWLRGFVEVQAYASGLSRRCDLAGPEARRFLRGLPRQARAKDRAFLVTAGDGLRISQTASPGAVPVGGLARLRFVEPLIRHIQKFTLFGDEQSGVTGWDFDLGGSHLQVLLSPAPARGFSGEGQVLSTLARTGLADGGRDALARTRAALAWQARITPADLARDVGADASSVSRALARLGSQGLVGFDLRETAYYHRVLPFDLSAVERLHPRLAAAREIAAAGGVTDIARQHGEVEAFVQGATVAHRVRLGPAGFRCSCPWFSDKHGAAGPCKHVLALEIALETQG